MEDQVQIIASDAGGTMTDMIVVDSQGNFTIGKASTTGTTLEWGRELKGK
jgi:N-methylhydantoinase A/oxoprolinase/acetone carboxylase beta subunit